MKQRLLALLLCLTTILTLLAGCESSGNAPTPSEEPAASADVSQEPAPVEESPEVIEPYDENGRLIVPFVQTQQLSVWDVLEDGTDPLSTLVDSQIGYILNVSLSYSYAHPSTAAEQFELMMASGEYFDLLYNAADYYPGGADAAIDQGAIANLQGIGAQAPNLSELIREYGESFPLSEQGRIYQLPIITTGEFDPDTMGVVTRKDGLDYLEITSPETYDELYFLLAMLKSLCGAKRGYLLPSDGFSPGLAYGFGAYDGFYQVDNVVKYGFLESSYKEYMDYVYTLLDRRLAIFEQEEYTFVSQVYTSWVTCWYGGGDSWAEASSAIGEENLIGIPWPVSERGESVHFIPQEQSLDRGMCISASAWSQKEEMLTALINYLYSDDFTAIANCGVEGESFSYVDNQAVLSDSILTAADPEQALNDVGLLMNLPHREDTGYLSALCSQPLAEAINVWATGTDGAWLLPELELSDSDQARVDEILADVQALTSDFLLGYIQGEYDAYDYEELCGELTDLGIREAIDIYQLALTGETVPYEKPEQTLADAIVPSYSAAGTSPGPAIPVTSAEPSEEPVTEEPTAEEGAPTEGETVPSQEPLLVEPETPAEQSPEPSTQPSVEPSVEPSAEQSPGEDELVLELLPEETEPSPSAEPSGEDSFGGLAGI